MIDGPKVVRWLVANVFSRQIMMIDGQKKHDDGFTGGFMVLHDD